MRMTLKLYNGNKVKKYLGTSVRRLLYYINHVNFDKAYLKVKYGKFLDQGGKMAEFYNDGYYSDKNELIEVLKAFTE
jgi:hypothetical protein